MVQVLNDVRQKKKSGKQFALGFPSAALECLRYDLKMLIAFQADVEVLIQST